MIYRNNPKQQQNSYIRGVGDGGRGDGRGGGRGTVVGGP